MLKVFLVEDDNIIRESLRNDIPWSQFGYELVGEAADRETALEMIRSCVPHVLIMDGRVANVDGYSLSHIVRKYYPNMKIIIITDFDDLEYARGLILDGADQYLLKPITRASLRKAMDEMRVKLESQHEQVQYIEQFREERQVHDQYFERDFFENVFNGKMSMDRMYEEAKKLDLDIQAPCYNLILLQIQEKNKEHKNSLEKCQRCQDEVVLFLQRDSSCRVFRWSIQTYVILLMGERGFVKNRTDNCVHEIGRICKPYESSLNWYVAAGESVDYFGMLNNCYRNVNHIFSFRYFLSDDHILTRESVNDSITANDTGSIEAVNVSMVRPAILQGFLEKGRRDEVEEFTVNYLENLAVGMKSQMFRDYMVLNIRFTVLNYVAGLRGDQRVFLENTAMIQLQEVVSGSVLFHDYMKDLLICAIRIRDMENDTRGCRGLKRALDYIDNHYMMEEISLNMVASATDFSPNYFSALFSQEMKITFVEYVTEKRMEQAKFLLRESNLRSSEIAPRIGYRDPHYFSYVFKRTQGCTPREYRARNNRQ